MEWNPIETLPDEGEVLVIGGIWDGEVHGIDKDDEGPWLVTLPECWVKGCDCYTTTILDPTHWSPLPPPPPKA
ncbi:hypothetical protein HME9302_00029 [Alteripontixanthobacter maritimus]|uniref:DUF551 domain-containing protein n=1 Tax=Alteripontixanthobacter maritimus TaxID=2161824 RepID=A0A369QC21_9SPHN|nr:hypothetical protein HME9302_01003 [Alteripontixanthobacter maritimus]RDC66578.1 hypothetical protein HME9302_00029 [Alteripontixanthobacter maritimus]